MSKPYSLETVRALLREFEAQALFRRRRARRHEAGDILSFDVRGVWPPRPAKVKLAIERYVGGGYAGQVYKVRVLSVEAPEGPLEGLAEGGVCALKVLVPVSRLGRLVRGFFFALGFQAPFAPQVNQDAVRAGALWQKFIRRAAGEALGSERAVVDVLATLVDPTLGSCGELSEWVDGRLWRYEIDDRLFPRLRWKPGRPAEGLGSPEYRAKRTFMRDLVALMRSMGARELARQYEWWTLKSQPNALKRLESEGHPEQGLVAVDFRAGMALLPFLPQCPADLRLILEGLGRGRFVQFDRGDLRALRAWVEARKPAFAGMDGALDELEEAERGYRDSMPDVFHHRLRLITRPRLWASIAGSWVKGWEVRGMADPAAAERFRKRPLPGLAFFVLGVLPVLTPLLFLVRYPGREAWLWPLWLAPLLGPFLRRLWGRADVRHHVAALLSVPGYFKRAVKGHVAEALVGWHRSGRVSEARALAVARRPWLYFAQLPLAMLPAGLHRFLTDKRYFRERLDHIFVRPFRLYFRPEVREKWLRDMVDEGERRGMLNAEEAGRIRSQIGEPFIQKYLKCLAVHILTLPVTQVISVVVAFVYVQAHPELTWQQASLAAGVILGLFQVTPVSPGSFLRGLYTTFLVIKERNIRDYKLALAISYFKYIGYLAFPLQMAYRYPELARFMAGHWATSAVHIVPVFGERGAWLEHAVFDAFYNFPLSLGVRVRERDRRAAGRKPRWSALPLGAALGAALAVAADFLYIGATGSVPALRDIWWAVLLTPLGAGYLASFWSRRGRMGSRLTSGVAAGALTGLAYGLANAFVMTRLHDVGSTDASADPLLSVLWKVFIFALLAIPGAFLAELRPPR